MNIRSFYKNMTSMQKHVFLMIDNRPDRSIKHKKMDSAYLYLLMSNSMEPYKWQQKMEQEIEKLSILLSDLSNMPDGTPVSTVFLTQDHVQSLISGLLFACPMDDGNPIDCPLHDVRSVLTSWEVDKMWGVRHIIQALTVDQGKKILAHHQYCLQCKER